MVGNYVIHLHLQFIPLGPKALIHFNTTSNVLKTIVAAVPVTSAAVPVPFFEHIYIENNAAVPVGGTDRAHEAPAGA